MARIKIKNTIKNTARAEEAMRQINLWDGQFIAWDIAEAEAIQKVREKFNEERKAGSFEQIAAQRDLLIRELEAWAKTASIDWKKKTLEFTAGRLGYRTMPPTVKLIKKIAKSFKAAIELLEGTDLSYYVRREPTLDKEQILADSRAQDIDAPELAKCGLKVDQADTFWIETASSKTLEEAKKRLKNA